MTTTSIRKNEEMDEPVSPMTVLVVGDLQNGGFLALSAGPSGDIDVDWQRYKCPIYWLFNAFASIRAGGDFYPTQEVRGLVCEKGP
jgi:hypothetical protein